LILFPASYGSREALQERFDGDIEGEKEAGGWFLLLRSETDLIEKSFSKDTVLTAFERLATELEFDPLA